jgi:hypothetical protein
MASEITAAGGRAEVAVVATLDEQAVDKRDRAVAAQAGSIEMSSSLVSRGEVRGIPLIDLATADSVVVAQAARVPRSGARHDRAGRPSVCQQAVAGCWRVGRGGLLAGGPWRWWCRWC